MFLTVIARLWIFCEFQRFVLFCIKKLSSTNNSLFASCGTPEIMAIAFTQQQQKLLFYLNFKSFFHSLFLFISTEQKLPLNVGTNITLLKYFKL